jgi:hypothetical protein
MLRFGYCSLFPTRLSANSSELSWAHLVLFSTRRTSEMLTKSRRINFGISTDQAVGYGNISDFGTTKNSSHQRDEFHLIDTTFFLQPQYDMYIDRFTLALFAMAVV